jgi:hypothetical protein
MSLEGIRDEPVITAPCASLSPILSEAYPSGVGCGSSARLSSFHGEDVSLGLPCLNGVHSLLGLP